MIEDYWLSEYDNYKDVDLYSGRKDNIVIGDMTQEELLEAFEISLGEEHKTTRDFLIAWCEITDKNTKLIRENFPEHFL